MLRSLGVATAGVLAGPSFAADHSAPALTIALSPWPNTQMMEPLGTTDGSVEASWDHMRQRWRPEERAGNAQEAAAWVDYCNNPANPERIAHGAREPIPIKVLAAWQ